MSVLPLPLGYGAGTSKGVVGRLDILDQADLRGFIASHTSVVGTASQDRLSRFKSLDCVGAGQIVELSETQTARYWDFVLRQRKPSGAGTITATAAINPDGIRLIYVWANGNDVSETQNSTDRIRKIAFRYPLSAALKSVHAEFRGEPDWRRVRSPLTELSHSDHTNLINALSDAGFQLTN